MRRRPPWIRTGTIPEAGSAVSRRSISIVPTPARNVATPFVPSVLGAIVSWPGCATSTTPVAATAAEGSAIAATGSSAQAGPSRGHAASTTISTAAAHATAIQPNPNSVAAAASTPSATHATHAAHAFARATIHADDRSPGSSPSSGMISQQTR